MHQRRNQNRNQKISCNKQKWKTTYQNLWDVERAILKRKSVVITAYIKKKERSQVKLSNFTLHGTRKRGTN